MYAGGVSEEYGVGRLLEAHRLAHGAFNLTIYGKGPLTDTVKSASQHQAGLRYGGVVEAKELPEIYAWADALVNPRPVNQMFVKYSFPSKLLEYMESGTPVVSTQLPGIPAEYWSYITPTRDSPSDIADVLVDVVSGEAWKEKGRRARAYVRAQKGAEPQGWRLRQFLGEMVCTHGALASFSREG